jgi:hypothetical protein
VVSKFIDSASLTASELPMTTTPEPPAATVLGAPDVQDGGFDLAGP